MAWQLIYTSAPRLLEAGRSGFGTVARHRAIHPILASALERDSQFDRSAVRGRVVFAHRIVAAGGSRFHVLSCIRETAADYTGRTNHIAHHLIIDPREVSQLGSAAPTPVDICLGMTWRTAWPDAPKWLEASDEISLAQFHPATMPGGAWQSITGDARYAGVLRPAAGSALIVPPEADALTLFGESQTAAASQAWQATFTNCIQPTDDLSEFRWVAVEAASPAREKAVAGRTVLDLTAPETLPAPPESRSKLFIPAPDAVLPAPSSLAAKSQAKPVGNLFDDQLAAHAPRAPKRTRRKSALLPYIVALILLGGAAIYFGMTLLEEAPELTTQRAKIREEVNAAFPGLGMETAQTLSQVSKEQLPAALAIARTAREAHEALQKQQLPAINTEEVRGKAKVVSLNIPQTVGRIFDLYSTHFEFQHRLEKFRNSAPEASQLGELESLWKAVDQNTENLADPQTKQLHQRAMKSVESLWAERLLDVLKTDASPKENADWFHKQLVSLPAGLAESQPAKAAKKLIEDWRVADSPGADKKKLQSLITEGRDAWPAWLKTKAEAQIENKPNQVDKRVLQPTDAPNPENVAAGSASKPFEGDLIIVTNPTAPAEWAEFARELAAGNCELWGIDKGSPTALGGSETGNFRFGASKMAFSFKKKENSFQATANAQNPPYELELKRDKKAFLTAWVSDGKKPFRSVEGGLARAGDEIQVKDPLAISLLQLAQEHRCALTLSSANWLSVGTAREGKASIAAKASELKEVITKSEAHLKYLKDVQDGKAFPANLGKAISDMGKYAGESFKKPKKDGELKEIKNEEQRKKAEEQIRQYKNAVPPNPTDPSSMGDFFILATDTNSSINGLHQIGDGLKKGKGNKDVASVLSNALGVIADAEKYLNSKTQIQSYSNETEKQQRDRDRNEAERELKMVKRLEAFLVAIQSLPKDRQTEAGKIPGKEAEIENAKNNPLLKSGFLPSGDYTIFVKPPASANPIPFIRFTIKP